MPITKETRGRKPKERVNGEYIGIRISMQSRAALTEYRRRQPGLPSEASAIREFIDKELKKGGLL